MIKFFRKIRLSLLSEGNTGKPAWPVGRYLKYAIGEIVLVMVGILLALQVSEWNNEKNRRKAEAIIIEQLIADLNKSEEEIKKIIEDITDRAKSSAIICHAFWKKDTPNDSILTHFNNPLGNTIYSPTLGSARSLINSGNISLIQSETLKNAITSYVEEVDYKLRDISRYEETYYRNGIILVHEIVPGVDIHSKSRILDQIEKTNSPDFQTTRNDDFRTRPNVIEKAPFEMDIKEVFQEKKIYRAYTLLLIAHRNSATKYTEIKNITRDLLDQLNEIKSN
ncbi:DUF6090 family protein [Algoriphagus pacificus]|uniref:Uncharacterized protein n=1 Tax=Algoriphagus pacificus TaxID=2811234 RepID=A0ABS3CAW2_9BACT|nr:DUF6090 family protein [Algoriphagus pacificus]MBN7814249.1 hypothetical protein [Algoriphagus pacificus]